MELLHLGNTSHLCKILIVFVVIAKAAWPIQAYATTAPSGEPEIALAPVDEFADYTPSPTPYGDEISPDQSQYPFDDMESSYLAEQNAPEYPYEDEYDSPSPAPAPEYPYEDEYDSPSPAPEYPYKDEYDSPSPAPEYPYEDEYDSPSPASEPYYMEDVVAPQVEGVYKYDSPSEAPSATEFSSRPGSPPVMEFNYRAEENGSREVEGEESGYENEKTNGIGRIGIVMGTICLVGLGSLVYNKWRNQKRKHKLYMQLAKRQDL